MTELLQRMRDGDVDAADNLSVEVHEALESLARSVFAPQSADHTLQATALLHEAWLKMSPPSIASTIGSMFSLWLQRRCDGWWWTTHGSSRDSSAEAAATGGS